MAAKSLGNVTIDADVDGLLTECSLAVLRK